MRGEAHPYLWVLAAVGPLTLLLAMAHACWAVARRGRLVKVTGCIINWEHRAGASHPVISFTTADGIEITGVVQGVVDLGIYREKDVPVWYDPSDPERFSTQVSPLGRPGLVLLVASLPLLVLSWFALREALLPPA